jgi:hypothetical protein
MDRKYWMKRLGRAKERERRYDDDGEKRNG